jgi:hypothetical protein
MVNPDCVGDIRTPPDPDQLHPPPAWNHHPDLNWKPAVTEWQPALEHELRSAIQDTQAIQIPGCVFGRLW